MTSIVQFLPLAQQPHHQVASELFVEKLANEVQVANKGRLQDDGNVAGVEQFDGVGSSASSYFFVLDGNIDFEALEVDNNEEHQDGGQQTVDVGQTRTIEGLLDGCQLVSLSSQSMEQSHYSSFVFLSRVSPYSHWGKCFPQNSFTHIHSNKQIDA